MLVTKTSQYSGITREKELDITLEQMEAFTCGTHIQRVFPNLSSSDREFILTGITQDEWDELFPPEPEENEPEMRYAE